MVLKDYYSILNIPRNATEEEIKKAYRIQAKKFHPDSSNTEGSEDIFKEINEAYKVLSNAKKKEEYDASLGIGKPSHHHHRKTYRPPPKASQPSPYRETTGRDQDSKRIWRERNASLKSQTWSSFGKGGRKKTGYSSFKYFQNQPSNTKLGIFVGISLAILMFIFVFWLLEPLPFKLVINGRKNYRQNLAGKSKPSPFYPLEKQQRAQNLQEQLYRESINQWENQGEDFDQLSENPYRQDPNESYPLGEEKQYEEDKSQPQHNYQDTLLDDIWEDIEDQASDTSDF